MSLKIFIIIMQKSQSTAFSQNQITSLPIRPKLSKNIKGYPETFVTNYYRLIINEKKAKIYQYDITFIPEIEKNSRILTRALIQSAKASIEQKLGGFHFRGRTLWATKQGLQQQQFNCRHTSLSAQKDPKSFIHRVKLKKTRDINLRKNEDDKDSQNQNSVLQILNTMFRSLLLGAGMIELDKTSKYYNKQSIDSKIVSDAHLKVWRGFYASIHKIQNSFYLSVDISTRILSQNSVLFSLSKQHQSHLIGRTVLAQYGNYKTYKIQKISNKTPKSNLASDDKRTFIEYYQKQYGITINNQNQNLILSSTKLRNSEGKLEIKDVYLVPQLLFFTGIGDKSKKRRVLQQLATVTKLTPKDSLQQNLQFLSKLKKNDFFEIQKQQQKVPGYVLKKTTIIAGKEQQIVPKDQDGRFSLRNQTPLKVMNIKKWILVFSQIGDNKELEICDKLISGLQQTGKGFGIQIAKPTQLIVRTLGQQSFIDKIRSDFKKNGKQDILIVVTLLKQKEQKYYNSLKKLLISQIGVPHQAVLTKTVDDQKKRLSVCANIILQMNTKIGCPLWKINTKVDKLKDKKVLIGGMSIFHKLVTKNQSCCAFVGNIDNQNTKVYSKAKLIPQDSKRFQSIKQIIDQWVKQYCKTNKAVPDYIFIYREGVGDSQIKSILQFQVKILLEAISLIKKKMKKEDYNPGIAFITVNTKINQRFYQTQRSRSRDRTKGKDSLGNPCSGSVIGAPLTKKGFDFHMSPHYVNQGRCTPTNFNVIFNNSNLQENDFWGMTFQQCFGYFNWQGPVRTPAALQYANKLATLVGDSLKRSAHEDLKKSHYFL